MNGKINICIEQLLTEQLNVQLDIYKQWCSGAGTHGNGVPI